MFSAMDDLLPVYLAPGAAVDHHPALPPAADPHRLFARRQEGLFELGFYSALFWLQVLFYAAALTGWFLENRQTRVKLLFVPIISSS